MTAMYYFEAFVSGKRQYIGKVWATEDEIRAAFPRGCSILDRVVTITRRP